MRKIKYLLALCLTVLCVGAISANAAVQTTMADEITLFENLGFDLPEKTNETDLVTRAEFVGTITQFLNRDFAPGGVYSFEDVPKDSELSGALSYAVAMGIVSDDTMFNPDNNVTYPQAMKMAVAFIGRGAEAEYLGGFDGGGYSAVASTMKLYAGLQDGNGEFVTLRDFYKIMYNVGQADMLVRDSYNNLVPSKSPFAEFFNMYEIKGILNGSDMTGLDDEAYRTPNGMIKIDKNFFYYDNDDFMGYNVNGWASYSAVDHPTAVLVKPYRNETVEMNLSTFDARQEGNFIYYYDGTKSKEKKIRIDDPSILYNGVAASTLTLADILACEHGTIKFIDNDLDGHYEVISVSSYRPVVASATSAVSMRILDKNGEKAVELGEDNGVKECVILKEGKEIEFSEILAGDVLIVYESAKNECVKIEVLTKVVEGKVSTRNATEIKIGDTMYLFSQYFGDYYLKDIKSGDEIEVALSDDGVVHALATDLAVRNSYGYIIKEAKYNQDTEKYSFTLACADGEIRKVEITEKTKTDGDVLGKVATMERINSLFSHSDPVVRFIKYRLNSSMDEVQVIDTHTPLVGIPSGSNVNEPQTPVYVDEKTDNDMTEFSYPSGTNWNPGYQNGTWSSLVNVVGTTKVFKLALEEGLEDDEIFRLGSSSDINNNIKRAPSYNFNNRQYRIYNVDTFGSAEAVLLITGADDSSLSKDSPKGVVFRVSESSNLDDEIVYEVVLYNAGEYKTYFTDEDLYAEIKNGTRKLSAGDYITYNLGSGDVIDDTMWIYDHDATAIPGVNPDGRKFNPAALANASQNDGEKTIVTTPNQLVWTNNAVLPGWIYDFSGSSIALLPTGHFNKPDSSADASATNMMTSLPTTSAGVAALGRSFIPANASTSISVISTTGGKVGIEEVGVADLNTYAQLKDKSKTDFAIMLLKNGVLQEILVFR